jgi:hypothetical protein
MKNGSPMLLEANTGFFDPVTVSYLNFNRTMGGFIHATPGSGDPAFASTYMIDGDSVPDKSEPSNFSIHLSGLSDKPFKVTVYGELELGNPSAKARFFVEKIRGSDPPVFFPDPFVLQQSSTAMLIISIVHGTDNGNYGLNIWGMFPAISAWFNVQRIEIIY